jgi:hypothetical protein
VTKQVVYVGQGTGARAWVCDRTQWRRNSGETVGKAHAAWIENLLTAGYTPADFVHIEAQGLSREEALSLEKATTAKFLQLGKLFNIDCYGRPHTRKLTSEDISCLHEMRDSGLSWPEITRKFGKVSQGTIWRALNKS